MTFSIVGVCERTSMAGVAITTSSISVGSRCPWVRAGAGAVATQNITDPSIGNQLLDLMEKGSSAPDSLAEVMDNRAFSEYRQVTAVDLQGNIAERTGSEILGTHAVSHGDFCVAAGNLLSTTAVPVAMTDAFSTYSDLHLAERLLRSLEAGVSSGGEEGPTHSAALLVSSEQPWPLVDLRVDWSDDPIIALRELWVRYEPQMNDYLNRALNPEVAPSYGVPGDP
ncbi:DUF1028 domain-containing protein [Arenicellales bacterium nBUS_45]